MEKTVSAYKTLLGTGKEPAELNTEHKEVRTPYIKYKGADITDTPMKVESVFSDNFWFEIIQPLGNDDPWAAWLKEHGTSICSICLLSDGPLDNDEETMKNEGFDSLFKHEKGICVKYISLKNMNRYRNQFATAVMSGLYTIRTKTITRGKTPAILIHQRNFKRLINSTGRC